MNTRLEISENGAIFLDHADTGLSVCQTRAGTEVYRRTGDGLYERLPLPRERYALSTDAPASGVAGLADFERDVRALIEPSSYQ